MSSEVGLELKASGYDGIIIRGGKAKTPVYLLIHNDNVEIRDASKYWGGMGGTELYKTLLRDVYEEIKKKEKTEGSSKRAGDDVHRQGGRRE